MQKNPEFDDTQTYTLSPSSILMKRYGHICILTLVNYASVTAITGDTKICDLPVSAEIRVFGVAKTLGNVDVLVFIYENGLYISGITGLPANTPTYGTLVFAV